MAQELITWCDVHMADDDDARVPGVTVEISIDRQPSKLLDICDSHYAEYIAPLEGLLADARDSKVPTVPQKAGNGTKARGAAAAGPKQGEWYCLDPDCPRHNEPYFYIQSLRSHLANSHGMTQGAHEKKWGAAYPRPSRSAPSATPDPKFACPECGREAANAAGLKAHRRTQHPAEYAADQAAS